MTTCALRPVVCLTKLLRNERPPLASGHLPLLEGESAQHCVLRRIPITARGLNLPPTLPPAHYVSPLSPPSPLPPAHCLLPLPTAYCLLLPPVRGRRSRSWA